MFRMRSRKPSVPLFPHTLPFLLASVCLSTVLCFGQSNTSYTIDTVAGHHPLGNGEPAWAALLDRPVAVAVYPDPNRFPNLYISDFENRAIRVVWFDNRIDGRRSEGAYSLAFGTDGTLYHGLAGKIRVDPRLGAEWSIEGSGTSGEAGDSDATDGSAFGVISGIAVAQDGTVYFSDASYHVVRKATPTGAVHTIAGTLDSRGYSGDGGPATAAQLDSPQKLTLDSSGNLYIADSGNSRVRRLSPDGIISTVAGNGLYGPPQPGEAAVASPLGTVSSVAIDASDNLYFTDAGFHQLLHITADGILQRMAGTGERGFGGDLGPADAALLDSPQDLAVDHDGGIYIVDTGNDRVRKMHPYGHITTIAGRSHFGGDYGSALWALLNQPRSVAVASDRNLFIADTKNHRIRKVTADGTIITVGGIGLPGFSGDGMSATSARLEFPDHATLDIAGNLFFADSSNRRVRRIGIDGSIQTVAGTGAEGDSGDGGSATAATFRAISGLVAGPEGELYVSDCGSQRIRRISPDGGIEGFAGTGASGFSGDGGPAGEATLSCPGALAMSALGTLYLLDTGNSRVRSITREGIITTVAGGDSDLSGCCFGTDALAVTLPELHGLAIDNEGSIFLSTSELDPPDSVYSWILKIEPDGRIWTIAGSYNEGYEGDRGPARLAEMYRPSGLAADTTGTVYFADTLNHRVRSLTPNPPRNMELVGGNNQTGTVGFRLPEFLVVKVTDGQGQPAVGVSVGISVVAGDISRPRPDEVSFTDRFGVASFQVHLGDTPGDIVLRASVEGLPPVDFQLHAVLDPTATRPRIMEGGVVGSPLSHPTVTAISAGGLATVYGLDFTPPGRAERAVSPEDLVDGRLPTKLAGVCVLMNDKPTYLLYVGFGQVNLQVPALADVASAEVRVLRNCGTPDESISEPLEVPVRPATPEFFYWNHLSGSVGYQIYPIAAANPITNVRSGTPGLLPALEFVPARPGELVDFYATGFGATDPYFPPGELPDRPGAVINPVEVVVGGTWIDEDDILYAGPTHWAGVYILRIRLPATLADGDHLVRVVIGENTSPAGYLTVAR